MAEIIIGVYRGSNPERPVSTRAVMILEGDIGFSSVFQPDKDLGENPKVLALKAGFAITKEHGGKPISRVRVRNVNSLAVNEILERRE